METQSRKRKTEGGKSRRKERGKATKAKAEKREGNTLFTIVYCDGREKHIRKPTGGLCTSRLRKQATEFGWRQEPLLKPFRIRVATGTVAEAIRIPVIGNKRRSYEINQVA